MSSPVHRDATEVPASLVWTANGTRHVDDLRSYGPIVLGHADPHFNDAVCRTIDTVDRGEAFRVAMLDAGILPPTYVITDARICAAFTDDDIDHTIDAARHALAVVRRHQEPPT